MQVDQAGRWIDPGDIDETIGYRLAHQLGLDTSCLDSGLGNVLRRSLDSEVLSEIEPLPFETEEDFSTEPSQSSPPTGQPNGETDNTSQDIQEWPSDLLPDLDLSAPPKPTN